MLLRLGGAKLITSRTSVNPGFNKILRYAFNLISSKTFMIHKDEGLEDTLAKKVLLTQILAVSFQNIRLSFSSVQTKNTSTNLLGQSEMS